MLHQCYGGVMSRPTHVYLFGRADFTVSYFGANIYPENVSVGLEQPSLRGPKRTGFCS